MSPSKDHERNKSYIGRLIEAYALERGDRPLALRQLDAQGRAA